MSQGDEAIYADYLKSRQHFDGYDEDYGDWLDRVGRRGEYEAAISHLYTAPFNETTTRKSPTPMDNFRVGLGTIFGGSNYGEEAANDALAHPGQHELELPSFKTAAIAVLVIGGVALALGVAAALR